SPRCRIPGRTEYDLLAAEVFEAVDFRPHRNVELVAGEADDVADPVLYVRRLAHGTEIFQDIRLDERHVDAAKVQQVFQVGAGAACNDRKHVQPVAVVKRLSEVVGETQVGAVVEAGGDADHPGVDALLEDVLRSALLRRFRNGLARDCGDADQQAKSQPIRSRYDDMAHSSPLVAHPPKDAYGRLCRMWG